ncbi:Uncharacterized protein Rs2_08112 [Raphanus sativus]|nr:Uncharacterized protein Rs2_08112 [Raphanus sativus]
MCPSDRNIRNGVGGGFGLQLAYACVSNVSVYSVAHLVLPVHLVKKDRDLLWGGALIFLTNAVRFLMKSPLEQNQRAYLSNVCVAFGLIKKERLYMKSGFEQRALSRRGKLQITTAPSLAFLPNYLLNHVQM